MPRPNPERQLRGEANLADRVAYERKERGWTTEGLAQRMTAAGCPINQSAIWKIEDGKPRRRITYDEALAFAEVFGIPLDELSAPPELAADRTALRLLDEFRQARQVMLDAFYRLSEHWATHPQVAEVLNEHMANDDVSRDVLDDILARVRARREASS
ncbi:MAG: helix-turn-helix transcriptional regulator [Micromonospora sp.]